jgi:hypothetical protein
MATDFLEDSGTNGFIATPYNLMSTELNALANGNSAVSSAGGTSGVFSQSNSAHAIWAQLYFVSGGSFTPASPNYIAGWFLFSPDGGSTFEAAPSNADMARTPDFIIPLTAAAYASGNIAQASGIVRVPWWSNKVQIVSHAGATLPATGNLIKAAPVAIQY